MSRRRVLSGFALLVGLAAVFGLSAGGSRAQTSPEGVIIECSTTCGSVVSAVTQLGGTVTFDYVNVEAIAARIARNRLVNVAALPGVKNVARDDVIEVPEPVQGVDGAPQKAPSPVSLDSSEYNVFDAAEVRTLAADPANYLFNNDLTGASTLHAQGKIGEGVVVGVIDSGTANSPVVPALEGTVIGGESFVPASEDSVQSATSRRNDHHGTWVGSMIAAHVAFGFNNTSSLVRAVKRYAPGSVLSPCPDPPPTVVCFIPMIGTAPAANIYALKVFPSTGGGAPESRVIAAMDRAITLRQNFNRGMSTAPVGGTGTEDDPFRYNALKIQVVNMSLGGPTLFAGLDLEDLMTLKMLLVGITLVTSAGNSGFAAMTGGSPGTGIGSLTVGAASEAVHERIVRDLQFGPGLGELFRPTTHLQTAFFSSRGPTADGRLDPDILANGDWSFAQGTCSSAACLAGTGLGSINFVSGTSFSAPTVAGAAALLRADLPSRSAAQIRNGLIESANATLLGDGSGRIDQGKGFLDVPAAHARLASGNVSSNVLPNRFPSTSVKNNVIAAGFNPVTSDSFSTHVSNLRPGQVSQFFVETTLDTDRLTVTLSNIAPELPPAQQNQLFGDDIFLNIVDAPTSFGEFRAIAFVNGTQTFTIDNPQTGLVRVALQGDWTNAGRISADLAIQRHRTPLVQETASGRVRKGDLIPIRVNMPPGTQQAVFLLSWGRDWGSYPTNDIDLYVTSPSNATNADGATLAAPERVVINNPEPGVWTALVDGFALNPYSLLSDRFSLRVTADGVRLPRAP